jgi:hypothetical protein
MIAQDFHSPGEGNARIGFFFFCYYTRISEKSFLFKKEKKEGAWP